MPGAKISGHPIHAMLIVFPFGLLSTAVIFDIIRLAGGGAHWSAIAYYLIGAGVISGLIAAVFGLIDWLGIPPGTRAKRVGATHAIGNVIMVVLFAGSWWLRSVDAANPSGLAYTLSFVGILLALYTGWLGGEMVYRLGVGVESSPHPGT